MWHASIAPAGNASLPKALYKKMARKVLSGIGDASAGEWEEWGNAYHLRRRLSAQEQVQIGPTRDLRGTEEGWARLRAIEDDLRFEVRLMALAELMETP